jgi:hypothetical protein
MPYGKNLTKKQRAVIDDLFAGVADEKQILEKHKVSRRVFDKWLADENFKEEFERRQDYARRQSELIIVRYATFAAAKLVQLTESANQETARKACLDIINLLRPNSEPKPAEQDPAEQLPDLPPELASRLLTVLAGARGRETSSA